MEGIIPLIIIGIVLNMIIKAMRARTQKPPQKRPVMPHDLGQEVERPLEDRPRPQVPHTPLAPQPAPRVSDVRPAVEKRDPAKGVSLEGTSMEGTSLEGTSLETQHMMETDTLTGIRSPVMTGKKTAPNSLTGWFEGDGVVRGIVMREILSPPVSRRR